VIQNQRGLNSSGKSVQQAVPGEGVAVRFEQNRGWLNTAYGNGNFETGKQCGWNDNQLGRDGFGLHIPAQV
jgi:hypothetical protein